MLYNLLLLLFLSWPSCGLKAQRIYPYFSGVCQQNIDCPYIQTEEEKISDGYLTTFGSGEFTGSGTAYLYVVFNFPLGPNDKIGVKLGYNNKTFDTDDFLSTINFYPLDEDGFPFYNLDPNGIPIDEVIDFQSPQLELGESTFEIILDLKDFDFSEIESVFGIEMFIDNSSGIWTNKDFKVYEFYILDSSCQDYIDYIHTNELDNKGAITLANDILTLDPGEGFVEVSFLFDSYAYDGDSIYMVFEKVNGFSLETIEDYFIAYSYSDNVRLSFDVQINGDTGKLKEDSNGDLVLTFPVQESFNRIQFKLNKELVLKSLFRKSGGNPLLITPEESYLNEDGKFIYREGKDPIFLKPGLLNASGFQWFFDYTLQDPIINGGTKDGVSYSISLDGTLKIENLSPINDPFIVFLSAIDPVSGCTIVKKIDFEVEGIILPLIQISLKGQMLSNQTALLNWTIDAGEGMESALFRLEKAKDDLFFVPISEKMEWVNLKEYTFTDRFPFSGNNFYRISVKTKGSDEILYSEVINVRNDQRNYEKDFFVYPNPFWNYLNIELDKSSREPVFFNIYALDGRKVISLNASQVERVGNKLRLDLSFLKNGIYIFNIQNENFVKSFKVIKK